MWTIERFEVNGKNDPSSYMSDGLPVTGTPRGPAGASFRLYIPGQGMLDITDTGYQEGGPNASQLVMNGQLYWYDDDGAPQIAVSSDGRFTISGDGNDVEGELLPLAVIDPDDLALLGEMKATGLIPYGQLQPGEREYSKVEPTAKQYFAFSPSWSDLGLTIYDWTSADFFRMDAYRLYRYTAVAGQPLDGQDIVNAIWTSNWPPYEPADSYFMASLMMTPATTQDQVATQYEEVNSQLRTYLDALQRLTASAMLSMPRTSTIATPMLYSGQVAISNLGTEAMAVYFEEYPGNAGPVGNGMGMALDDALKTFMHKGSTLSLKTFVSFTDSREDAKHYANGIILEMSPAPDAATWARCQFITPLSNNSEKTEYTCVPGTKWKVTGSRVGSGGATVISVEETLE